MGSCLANMAAAGAAGWGALGGLSAVDREVVVVVDEEESTVAEMATVVAAREWAAAAVVVGAEVSKAMVETADASVDFADATSYRRHAGTRQ